MTADDRKARPVYSGVLRYFPKALLEIARVSLVGHEQHNPGTPMRWDRSKSPDEADALVRHLMQAGEIDSDGLRHTAKAAWRALALLEKELEDAERISHDERHQHAQPCPQCHTPTYPPGRCVGCQRVSKESYQVAKSRTLRASAKKMRR